MSVIGSLVGSGLGAAADYYINERNNAFNAMQAQLNRQFQTGEREATQDWNLEMWNRQNSYNLPSAQLDRLLQAGLNPVTAMSLISETGNSATSLPQSTPQAGSAASAAGMSQPGDQIASALNRAAQYEKTKEETKGQSIENEWNPKLKKQTLANLEKENDAIIARAGLDREQANQLRQLTPFLVKKTRQEVTNLKASLKQINKEVEKMDSEIDLLKKDITKVEKESAVLEEEALKVKQDRLRTLEQTRYDKWVAEFVEANGFDPKSEPMSALLQCLANGKIGIVEQMLDNILSTLPKIVESASTGIGNAIGSILEQQWNQFKDNLMFWK